jgi:hypothetical protein
LGGKAIKRIPIHYTYDEPFGTAECVYCFPVEQPFILESGNVVRAEWLQPGARFRMEDGAWGTVTAVERPKVWGPPNPVPDKDGNYVRRVLGTIKHKGIETIDVSWPGNTVTGSPDHKFYSVSRGGYVPASELQVGEILRTKDDRFVPVTSVGERKLGLIDLYNIEVEHFHNYYVGAGEGKSVLVHNGVPGAGCNINIPRDATCTITKIGDLTKQEAAALARVWRAEQPLSTLPLRLREQLAGIYSQVARANPAGYAQSAFNEARAAYLLGRGPNPGHSVNLFAERTGLPMFRR